MAAPKRSKTKSPRSRRKERPRPPPTIATISEVAAAAGVSTATVSRFFNSPAKLKERTASKVRKAVDDIGYVPNMMAGGLASSRSRLVAAVIPAISQSIFSSTIQALTDALADAGYSVILGLTGAADERVQRELVSIIGRRPDGIILTGSLLDGAARKQLKATGITIIETWDLPSSPIDLVVGVSHQAIGRAVARHVLALGRRQAFVISASGVRALARRDSFSRAMRENGAPEPVVASFSGTTTYGQGRRAMAAHLESKSACDVVVCSSDWSAHGALDELRARNIRVPQEVAVIGFGDLDFAAELSPALTTVKIDGGMIGRQAATFLMSRARGEKIERPVVDIGFTLITRDSGSRCRRGPMASTPMAAVSKIAPLSSALLGGVPNDIAARMYAAAVPAKTLAARSIGTQNVFSRGSSKMISEKTDTTTSNAETTKMAPNWLLLHT
jgi:LacI family gluconate utilization system Gnt-I transcriptional repressor